MPIHDWTRVPSGVFHDFHLAWIAALRNALNGGLLPDEYYALAEARTGGAEADVLTLERAPDQDDFAPSAWSPDLDGGGSGGIALADAPPRLSIEEHLSDPDYYALKGRRLVVRHVTGNRIVALIEIVSPGTKDGEAPVRQFVDKAMSALFERCHLALIDLFPPGPHDRTGMHGAIWSDLGGPPYAPPPGRPLTLAAYRVDGGTTAYVEPTAVGREPVDLPLFYDPDHYVNVPLAETYAAAYAGVPRHLRRAIEGGSGR